MASRAHLKLIVSEAPGREPSLAAGEPGDAEGDRCSMVVPVGVGRGRGLGTRATLVVLWSASAILLALAGSVALGWL